MEQHEGKKRHYLEDVDWGVLSVCVYKGVIVERLIGGFRLLNKTVKSAAMVDQIIDGAMESLSNSTKRDSND